MITGEKEKEALFWFLSLRRVLFILKCVCALLQTRFVLERFIYQNGLSKCQLLLFHMHILSAAASHDPVFYFILNNAPGLCINN